MKLPIELQILEILVETEDHFTPSDVANELSMHSLCSKDQWIEFYEAVDGLVDEKFLFTYDFKPNQQKCVKPTISGLWYYHTKCKLA
jgi:hypothetical protein